MSTVDTDLQQLVINVGTTAEIEAAISGGTITQDMLSITTDGADYVDVNLSNLSSVGKNISNWSSNITNCITDIPRDIKLELNNGTLTLKAGSKVYVPNGAGVFNTVTTSNDIVWSETYPISGKCLLFYVNNVLSIALNTACYSGTNPSGITGNYYNTSANTIDYYNNGTGLGQRRSFPICEVTLTNGVITSVDQVFNGFGYIGSTVFALPGVKGLIPNGRNEDGTLKNIKFTLNKVITKTSGNYTYTNAIIAYKEGSFELKSKEDWYYNQYYNVCVQHYMELGRVDAENGKITSFKPKTTFHAIDYNEAVKYSDKPSVSSWGMPSNMYIEVSHSNGTYTAPANGYFQMSVNIQDRIRYAYCGVDASGIYSKEWGNEYTTDDFRFFIPVKKGDVINYGLTGGSWNYVRFIYAQGEI